MKTLPLSPGQVREFQSNGAVTTWTKMEDQIPDAHTWCKDGGGNWIAWCGSRAIGTQEQYDKFTIKAYPKAAGIKSPNPIGEERMAEQWTGPGIYCRVTLSAVTVERRDGIWMWGEAWKAKP